MRRRRRPKNNNNNKKVEGNGEGEIKSKEVRCTKR